MLSLIVAMDRRGVIGRDGRLPWHLPADLRRFRAVTMGKPIVMGRKTHESIGRPLPGRENIVLSRDPDFVAPGCTVLHGMDEVAVHCRDAAEIMIMGGADLYRQCLPDARRIYLTQVECEVAGDTFFPVWEPRLWLELESETHAADPANEFSHRFIVLERRPGDAPDAQA